LVVTINKLTLPSSSTRLDRMLSSHYAKPRTLGAILEDHSDRQKHGRTTIIRGLTLM
jgi:hypothetical protein